MTTDPSDSHTALQSLAHPPRNPLFVRAELGQVERIVDVALHEDLASGDVTTRSTVPPDTRASAEIIAKEAMVFCGGPVAELVFARVDPSLEVTLWVADGDAVSVGTKVLQVVGNARAILAGERTALNLLQRACGIATMTARYVEAARDLRVCDTRKTMPGLRVLDRYAVRCGGGYNHRNDLGSGVLIKENHIQAAGGISAAVVAAAVGAPHGMRVECEVRDLEELKEALDAGADAVLLDNMNDATIEEAVALVGDRAIIEASGGITLERLRRLGLLGVDVVSVGALTHSVKAADLSLLFHT